MLKRGENKSEPNIKVDGLILADTMVHQSK